MGGNQVTEEGDTPKPGKPVGSMALTLYEDKNFSIGEPWSTGLFDCHENQTNAIGYSYSMSTLYPIRSDSRNSRCLRNDGLWALSYRAKLRKKYGLVEAPCEDVVSHIFCPCCSLCQEFRELKNRGLDPALGWNGVLVQQRGGKYQDQEFPGPPSKQIMYK